MPLIAQCVYIACTAQKKTAATYSNIYQYVYVVKQSRRDIRMYIAIYGRIQQYMACVSVKAYSLHIALCVAVQIAQYIAACIDL